MSETLSVELVANLRADIATLAMQLENMKVECDALRAQLTEAQSKLKGEEWISVGERLPEHEVGVLVANEHGYVGSGFYCTETRRWWDRVAEDINQDEIVDVTHWAVLPAPPNGGKVITKEE
jgi:hypothetical protein